MAVFSLYCFVLIMISDNSGTEKMALDSLPQVQDGWFVSPSGTAYGEGGAYRITSSLVHPENIGCIVL